MQLHDFANNKSMCHSSFPISHLSLQKELLTFWFWAGEYPITEADMEAEIRCPVTFDIYHWLHEVRSNKVI